MKICIAQPEYSVDYNRSDELFEKLKSVETIENKSIMKSNQLINELHRIMISMKYNPEEKCSIDTFITLLKETSNGGLATTKSGILINRNLSNKYKEKE